MVKKSTLKYLDKLRYVFHSKLINLILVIIYFLFFKYLVIFKVIGFSFKDLIFIITLYIVYFCVLIILKFILDV